MSRDKRPQDTALIEPDASPFAVEMPGFRHDGKRWVDVSRPNAPGVIAEEKPGPTQWSDLVTYRKTKLPPEPKVSKSRRRGGF
ncbi:hypothetical protein FVA81_24030 [Rhizobium sp. WL3]|uniref:hypothetical protein n=1 Tax=Rhizobium sp. WL3 TaxID=2603277 RepID=UPI0011C20BF4|nr:hypothetical protein [Rhizobium sp. WL3]QEE47485.1 hypothetical protein FVA81_24030 [Rhizobium sp. WL3]